MKAKITPGERKTLPQAREIKLSGLCAVDPGINGTGIALWCPGDDLYPFGTDVLNAPRKLTWWRKALYLADAVADVVDEHRDIAILVCECPQFFASAGGEMVAGRGDLVKLAIAVGCIAGRVESNTRSCEFFPVEVNDWKGQLSKENVERRIRRKLPLGEYTSHAWDAVGIGLFARGDFE